MGGCAGCTGVQAFSSFQLTTLGNNGPNGPTSVDGYATLPPPACRDIATQLVQSGALAIVPTGSGVQRFTVPITGTYQLDVNGEDTLLGLPTPCHPESCADLLSNMWHLVPPQSLAMLAPSFRSSTHHLNPGEQKIYSGT